MLQSALIFAVVLGILVVVHEFGHFIVAKWCGVRVEKFSIGFGPVIFGRKYGETEFVVSLLPLGGYVKLSGENPTESKGESWEFNSKSLLQKFAVVFAGPFMNAFLAFVIFAGIFMVGQPTMTTTIGKVLDDGAAKVAGVLEGDIVLSVNGSPVKYWQDMLGLLHESSGAVTLRIDRNGETREIVVTPEVKETKNILGKSIKIPFIGVGPSQKMVEVKSPFFEAIVLGAERVWMLTSLIFYSLWLMITGTLPFKDSVTGPIGIFFMTKDAAQMGMTYLLYFTGSLSVSLFVLNLLPIPALDGGHVLFIIIEKIKGSPLKDSFKDRVTQGGMIALLTLMAFVILQDVQKFSIIDNVVKVFRK